MSLRVSATLELPSEAVTETFAILAKRGVGKTYTASVLVEEMLKAGLPVVVVDPIGVWWGLRASADGQRPGLPIVVMGGDHGDVPLDATAGTVVADLIVDERLSCVLDFQHFRKAEQVRFMTDFAERLYHRNRDPLHLVLDEADAYAPQRPQHGAERLLGAVEDIVRRGRARGLGCTLITQRSAVLNKDVLTQVEVLIALRTIAPQDRAAIDEWVKVHGTPEQRAELMASLPSLPVGTAWFWSPAWLDLFERVEVRQRETFDSSATPKVGAKIKAPKTLADVDLAKLRERMAATVEKAKADDPKLLRARIAELERATKVSVKTPADSPPRVETVIERVEVPVLTDEQVTELRFAIQRLADVGAGLMNTAETIGAALARVGRQPPTPTTERRASTPRSLPTRAVAVQTTTDTKLGLAERKILSALAQYPAGRTLVQVAVLTGYAVNGGGFRNAVGALRTKGLVEGGRDNLRATDAGLSVLGPFDPLPTGRDLADHWLTQLGKAERSALSVLLAAYPNSLSVQDVADLAGYEASGGGFRNALGRLRTLELIEGRGELRASGVFFE